MLAGNNLVYKRQKIRSVNTFCTTMARLVSLVAVLTIVACVGANFDPNNERHQAIKREAKATCDAVRKIVIETPECKLRLASMANDFTASLYNVIYSLNNAVPNLIDDQFTEMSAIARTMGNFANDIQQCIAGDPETLKEKLAVTLEKLYDAIIKYENTYLPKGGVWNHFATVQLTRKNYFVLFAIYKLKYQALLFKKSNKELIPEIKESCDVLTDTLKAVKSTGKLCDDELRYAFEHMSTVTERVVYKTLNWVEVNPEFQEKEAKLRAAKGLADQYEKQILAITGNNKAAAMIQKLLESYDIGVNIAKVGATHPYPEHTGGIEFLRSGLFDSIALGHSYNANVKAALSGEH